MSSASNSPSSSSSILVHLVRHGEREALRQRSGQWDNEWAKGNTRCWDDPITELGKEQARESARKILAVHQEDKTVGPVRRILCSPFRRCIETARAMAEILLVPIEVDPVLCELLRTAWFDPANVPFDGIYCKVDRTAASLFHPIAPPPAAYEDEEEENLPRPKQLAKAILSEPEKFDGTVIVSHGGLLYWTLHAIAAQLRHTKHLGNADYAARSTIAFRPAEPGQSEADSVIVSNPSAGGSRWIPEIISPFTGPLRYTPGQEWGNLEERRKLFDHSMLETAGFASDRAMNILEVGSWEGRSAVFWLQHLPGKPKHMTLVDHFDDFQTAAGNARYEKLQWNLAITGQRDCVTVLPLFSLEGLAQLLQSRSTYDFIYIDADHTTPGVLRDLGHAWILLREGGLMLIDDYEWPVRSADYHPPYFAPSSMDAPDHPKRGIDAFLSTHKEELKVLHKGYQVLVQKTVKQVFPFPNRTIADSASLVPSSLSSSFFSSSSASSSSSSASDVTSVVAVLLPLTSRGLNHDTALSTLREFESCLDSPERTMLMVGIDTDDIIYAGEGGKNLFMDAFPAYWAAGRVEILEFAPTRPAKICHIATKLAAAAYNMKEVRCDYFVLLGDDVRIEPKRKWIDPVVRAFDRVQARVQPQFADLNVTVPHGFGVVALPDHTFPGFPTFPVLGRCHLDIFEGKLFPSAFLNQDADPYVWETYRPFGARVFAEGVSVSNKIGGDEMHPCRYERQHVDWKYDILDAGVNQIHDHIASKLIPTKTSSAAAQAAVASSMRSTLDVITPTYRGTPDILRRILSLTAPDDCDVRFIIIVDNPSYAHLRTELEQLFPGGRVLVRVNSTNLGASGSRNRGLEESTGKWTLFLDDDVIPDPWIIHRYVEAIRKDGDRACGFVGQSNLPAPTNYLTTGLTMSYLTYFWNVATLPQGGDRAPWAVTANVLARRGRARFDLAFLRTGGGEDIAYLRGLMQETHLPLLKAPMASITHPWWDGGLPNPLHYYKWGLSDHLLMDEGRFPEFTYISFPHAAECTIILLAVAVIGLFAADPLVSCLLFIRSVCAVWCIEFGLDIYRCMVSDTTVAGSVLGWRRVVCAIIACVYKNFCEFGHTWSWIRRGAPWLFCRRFDWWFGLDPTFISSTRQREQLSSSWFILAILISAALPGSLSVCLVALTLLFAAIAVCCFAAPSDCNPAQQQQQIEKTVSVSPHSVSDDEMLTVRVALTFDEAYAAPAAVVIQSLLKNHTASTVRVEIAVIDIGIEEGSWRKLVEVVQPFNASLHQVKATVQQNLAHLANYPAVVREKWALYSRLWLDHFLPADWSHVLYLDCDVLVCDSLVPLWHQLLSSSELLLAVRDMGVPNGAVGLDKFGWSEKDEYFNAGMLGLNLVRIRQDGLGRVLRSFARDFAGDVSLPHDDQCILNIVFWRRWKSLPFEYNVQGMGTYADQRTHAERHRCALYTPEEWQRIQRQAKIVHFTGPSLPSLADFLCPYVRAPSKPWSFFCHHPLRDEYMRLLAATPFTNWKPPTRKRLRDDFTDAIMHTINTARHQLALSAHEVELAVQEAMRDNTNQTNGPSAAHH